MIPCPDCGTPMTIFGKVEGREAIGCSHCGSGFVLVKCIKKPEPEEKKE